MNPDVEKIRHALEPEADIILAMVYGSLASEQTHPESDADVAVLASAPLTTRRRAQLIEKITLATGRPVDLIDFRTAGLPVLQSIHTGGKLIFTKNDAAQGELLSRYLIDRADFGPYRERILDERRQAWINA